MRVPQAAQLTAARHGERFVYGTTHRGARRRPLRPSRHAESASAGSRHEPPAQDPVHLGTLRGIVANHRHRSAPLRTSPVRIVPPVGGLRRQSPPGIRIVHFGAPRCPPGTLLRRGITGARRSQRPTTRGHRTPDRSLARRTAQGGGAPGTGGSCRAAHLAALVVRARTGSRATAGRGDGSGAARPGATAAARPPDPDKAAFGGVGRGYGSGPRPRATPHTLAS